MSWSISVAITRYMKLGDLLYGFFFKIRTSHHTLGWTSTHFATEVGLKLMVFSLFSFHSDGIVGLSLC